jgi:hypothetical protein
LSTLDLHCIRYNASDAEVWHSVSHATFWNKSTWLLPIHRRTEEHWVLAIIPVYQRRVFIFDSITSKGGWCCDLTVCSSLTVCLIT